LGLLVTKITKSGGLVYLQNLDMDCDEEY